MNHKIKSLSLAYDPAQGLRLLDQTLLPSQVSWVPISSPEHMIEAIQSLKVRGAPLIGISASLFLGHYSLSHTPSQTYQVYEDLKKARPTAVNLANNLNSCWQNYLTHNNDPQFLLQKAIELFYQDQELCFAMAKQGVSLLNSNESVLTYCNTGSLATAGIGTALGVIKQGFEQGLIKHVYASETRPLGQGARLTAYELSQLKIPHHVICDNMAATLMAEQLVTKIFVGADRITKKGEVANKIGTLNLAILAAHFKIPFYVVAPSTTFDFETSDDQKMVIEQRNQSEVLGIWNNSISTALNPAFDITPPTLITGIVTENLISTYPFWA